MTDSDIQNLPNYVAAEWEKPDNLLIAQRSAFTSEFVLKIDPAQVFPQEIIPDFNDDDNIMKDSSQGNPIPLLSVRFWFILDWLLSKWKLLEAAFQCPFIVLPDLTVYFNSTVKQNLYITADVSANTCTNCIKIYDEQSRE